MNKTGHLFSSYNASNTPLSIASPFNKTQNTTNQLIYDPNTYQSFIYSNPDSQGNLSNTQKPEEIKNTAEYWEDKQQDSQRYNQNVIDSTRSLLGKKKINFNQTQKNII